MDTAVLTDQLPGRGGNAATVRERQACSARALRADLKPYQAALCCTAAKFLVFFFGSFLGLSMVL